LPIVKFISLLAYTFKSIEFFGVVEEELSLFDISQLMGFP